LVQIHETPVSLREFEELAKNRLTSDAYDYYANGACDEITLRSNELAFQSISLRPRVLVDVSTRNMQTRLFGSKLAMPILIAPMAFQAMAHHEGELATARAAKSAGTAMIVSTLSNFSIEEIATVSGAALWFQIYVYKDKGLTQDLINRAEAAGYKALVVTVDTPVIGWRERELRNKFELPAHLKIKNINQPGAGRFPGDINSLKRGTGAAQRDDALTWSDLKSIVASTRLPVLVKGILRGDDALSAIECGAQGVIVSNHGGRQLDTAIASICALPEVAEAVGNRGVTLIDSGIRRGTDVLKALALGARAVLIGRPIIWGLAYDGERGIDRILNMIKTEFDIAMALSGCKDLSSITRDLLSFERNVIGKPEPGFSNSSEK
jgi:4-hydroxymandelate oxidase